MENRLKLHGIISAWNPGTLREEFAACDWWARMEWSDPPFVILLVPAWEKTRCRGEVRISLKDFRSANKVATRILEQTHTIVIDQCGDEWQRIWKSLSPILLQRAADNPTTITEGRA